MSCEQCFYCTHSYMAGDELLCLGFLESEEGCTSFKLDDYFLEVTIEIEKGED